MRFVYVALGEREKINSELTSYPFHCLITNTKIEILIGIYI